MNTRALVAMTKRVKRFDTEKIRLTKGWEFLDAKRRTKIVAELEELADKIFGELGGRSAGSLDLELAARKKDPRKVVGAFLDPIVEEVLQDPHGALSSMSPEEASATLAAIEYSFRRRRLLGEDPSEELAWWIKLAKQEYLLRCHTESQCPQVSTRRRSLRKDRTLATLYDFETRQKVLPKPS